MTTLAASIMFALGVAILLLTFAPNRPTSPFYLPRPQEPLRVKMQRGLKIAGVFDKSPSIVLIAVGAVIVVLTLLLYAILNSPWAFVMGPFFILGAGYIYYIYRQRSFMQRASDELVPFLNRISTAVGAGKPAQTAYVDAVSEANVLKEILEPSAARIVSGVRFTEALIETIPELPLRMWAVFVRQLELYDQLGGDVTSSIETTVSQLNQMLALQAEARADFAVQARQQNLITIIPFIGLLMMFLLLDNLTQDLFTSIVGIVGLVTGLGIMMAGTVLGRKQIRDIERKLNF